MASGHSRRVWNFDARESLLCAIAAALLGASAFVAWREVQATINSVAWVQHTFNVLLLVDRAGAALIDAESGQRGYLLTGDQRSLERYRARAPMVLPAIQELRASTADNPEAQALIDRLLPVAQAKLDEMAQALETRSEDGSDAGLATVRENMRQQTMETARALFGQLRDGENHLLVERLAKRDEHLRDTVRGALALGLLSGLFCAALIATLNRSFGRQRAAERNARESEERLRVTLQSIGDAVIATDVAGRVVYMNPVAQALTGWRHDDAQGMPLEQVFRIVNEFSREMVESPVSKVLRDGGVVGLANHTLLLARDGAERPIDDSGAPILGADGELMGVVLVFRDVSARRLSEQARERLVQAEAARNAAESANRAKDEFLAIVSHELRSPLTAALSWIELFKAGTLTPAEHARALETIERNLRLQSLLVSDLLDVSRIVAGSFSIERVPVDVSALVQRTLDTWRGATADKKIALEFEHPGPLVATADPDRLEQVLANLLANAIRFTPADGRVDVSLRADGDFLELVVRDTGQGIAADFVPHVFERFRQAQGAPTRRHGGLGLGLAIAKHLVERHDGTIEAESPGEGMGATFRVRLPRNDDSIPVPAGRGAETAGAALVGATVLLVEDHVDTRDALAYRLQSRGANVLVAGSVADAMRLLRESRPSILVSDLGLPEESGFALIRQLRALEAERGGRLPAIAVSGFVSPGDRREALAAGFDDHVAKPIAFESLLQKMTLLLARAA